ncbi:MAG: hypothetical protein ABJA18_01945 [bacterium]
MRRIPLILLKKETDSASRANVALRQVKPGQILQYSFIVYNARLDKSTSLPQLRTQVQLFRDGQLNLPVKRSH